MPKTKITITMEEHLVDRLNLLAESRGVNRSRLIEEALTSWERERRRQELVEGYRSMAEEDSDTAEKFLPAVSEVLK
ncbi:MAG: ribbon-helix-helix protein, CopG family [Planctomycetota bacterium]|nr:ribbon-helix-helix protein, CopG family [Planctomycetota bacterium]